ncbi:inosine/xanthosine triphosphatase [Shewanella sp. D64]|uniref:inosine/xanthosine triphosphatase n=1 Tax=unclassified Shewanella TaxID=196818 RepID=UPI0022BA6E1D|nr:MULTISPECIES: inosine/xanthosine triphosphatase [unclassified Shewanella]MEC4728130.1 inosine/xanthosine triphosphatase [Shewanella sp. D64]MEC4740250.1 inosine/xanthosine triphosphatase [Shewanella sp. E94]WBJ98261.1 inosine/xanthosine triphosphatase [Shewanella sp. MTB7]
MKLKEIKIVVGSTNPVKVQAAKSAVKQLFPNAEIQCVGRQAPSGVAEQPMTADETLKGAINRVEYCQSAPEIEKADLYIAIEGGVDNFSYGPATFAYVVIGHHGQRVVGRSALLPLPLIIYRALNEGEELGDVMDRLFNTQNTKQQGGAIGLLTQGVATRESIYTQALILAMAPLLNDELYQL